MTHLLKLILAVGLWIATTWPVVAQPKDAPGYWKFVEMVRVEYPIEKVHKFYPVTFLFEGNKLTAVARALNGNDPKIIHTEEHQVWTWTAPPEILVPGEKFPMKFELKLERPKFDGPKVYIGGRIDAGFNPPKPRDAAVYHVGADTRTEKGEKGGLDPRDPFQGGTKFGPATYKRESFVAVPGRKNVFNVKEHPDQISFRVGGVIGNAREFNTIYEYRWVEGAVPGDRGGAAGDKLAGGGKVAPPTPGVVGKWEYRTVDFSIDVVFGPELIERLTELGNDGWELAGMVANTKSASVRMVFKRPRK